MQIEFSAKELAYVTAVVGKMPLQNVGVAAYEILRDNCMSDIQALGYLHAFEQEFHIRQLDSLTAAADGLDAIADRYWSSGRWAALRGA